MNLYLHIYEYNQKYIFSEYISHHLVIYTYITRYMHINNAGA